MGVLSKRMFVLYAGSMPKVSEQHRESRRHAIHEGALRAFAEKGFAAATMADIIEATGLSAGAIYGYYAGKEELRNAVARAILADRRAVIAEAATRDPMPDPLATLEMVVTSVPGEVLSSGLLLQLWGEIATPEVSQLAREGIGNMAGAVGDYLAAWFVFNGATRPAARRRATKAAPVVMGLAQGCLVQATVLGADTMSGYFAAARDLLRDTELVAS